MVYSVASTSLVGALVNARETGGRRWLVLTHHIPPEPAYFRVKIRRRLERVGAVALKNSVYVLPAFEETLEDFHWIVREILREGGGATLAESIFLDGSTDDRLVADFREARETDYREVIESARALAAEATSTDHDASGGTRQARAAKLDQRLAQIVALDFFGGDGREHAEQSVAEAGRAVTGESMRPSESDVMPPAIGSGRTWVTRIGVKVDRIASAWLIRRFIDPAANFSFVSPDARTFPEGSLRFDMFEGEFTHEGDASTFETLLRRFHLDEPALAAIGEIVHDIDCKDDKYARPEAAGVASVIDGIVRAHQHDVDRLEQGAQLLGGLLAHFRATRG